MLGSKQGPSADRCGAAIDGVLLFCLGTDDERASDLTAYWTCTVVRAARLAEESGTGDPC
jgi:hypothetical protein